MFEDIKAAGAVEALDRRVRTNTSQICYLIDRGEYDKAITLLDEMKLMLEESKKLYDSRRTQPNS